MRTEARRKAALDETTRVASTLFITFIDYSVRPDDDGERKEAHGVGGPLRARRPQG